jgi:hypothetical protein
MRRTQVGPRVGNQNVSTYQLRGSCPSTSRMGSLQGFTVTVVMPQPLQIT